ncbi:MAG: FG-GAP-like repeat-containing protein [Bifidobacteriaceae bacterium]|jgi:hypothetical protein|nr:FG-GAP-like repeat-containing protein [Bifidobacteriaceae bacterium]
MRARFCSRAIAAALGVALFGGLTAVSAPQAAADPPPLVAAEDSGITPASADLVAEEVTQALPPGDQGVSPLDDAAPTDPARLGAEHGNVAVLEVAEADQAELSLAQGDERLEALVTAPFETAEFSVAGVTWEGDTPPGRILARAYQDGVWTEWFDLEMDDGPAATSAEGVRSQHASSPFVAAGATGIQIQVLSQVGAPLPDGVAPAIVPLAANADSAGSAAAGDWSAAAGGAGGAETASSEGSGAVAGPSAGGLAGAAAQALGSGAAALTQPAIRLRAEWGARSADYSGNAGGQPIVAAQLKGAIVHHQAGSNTYTQIQVPGIIKGIQSWHMDNNGWDDIGYNFLVDKYGVVWEGRQGGIMRNIVGAHATDFNTGSTGVCFLGDLDKVEPAAEALAAAGELIAWRLSLAGITDLRGTTVYPNDPKQQPKPVIAGHRDVNATTCPGRYLYAKLDVLREAIAEPVIPLTKVQTVVSPDLTGDGRGDLVVVDEAGDVFIYPMTSATSLGAPYRVAQGWQDATVLAPGDWNSDGRGDLMRIAADGRLYLHAGAGSGGTAFGEGVEVGHGWASYKVYPSSDVNGDGKRDLLAIDSANRLFLYRGTGRGGFYSGRLQVGHAWGPYQLHAAGNLNPDRYADILAINEAGELYTYLGRGGGGFNKPTKSGHGWNNCAMAAGADLSGDGQADMIGVCGAAKGLYLYHGRGNGAFVSKGLLVADWGA